MHYVRGIQECPQTNPDKSTRTNRVNSGYPDGMNYDSARRVVHHDPARGRNDA